MANALYLGRVNVRWSFHRTYGKEDHNNIIDLICLEEWSFFVSTYGGNDTFLCALWPTYALHLHPAQNAEFRVHNVVFSANRASPPGKRVVGGMSVRVGEDNMVG